MQNENTTATAPMTVRFPQSCLRRFARPASTLLCLSSYGNDYSLNAIYSGDAAQAIRAMAADGQHSRELSDSIMLAESFAAQLAEDAAEFDRASLTDEGTSDVGSRLCGPL